MADQRLGFDSKNEVFKNPVGFISHHEKPSQSVVDAFTQKPVFKIKGASALAARDAIANRVSDAIALGVSGASATFPTKPSLPSAKLPNAGPLLKSSNLAKANPYVLGASLLLHSEPLGADTFQTLGPGLRFRMPDDAKPSFEKKINGQWRSTGISAVPVFDQQYKIVAFEGLSQKDADLIGLPTTFPIKPPAVKPMGGFEAYQGDTSQRLETPAFNGNQQISSTQLPINNDLPTAGIMTSKQSEADERERSIDRYLEGKGHTVEINPKEGVHDAGRQGDRYIDGKLTEYKSIHSVKNATTNGLSAAISSRAMDARGQAPHIIIDTREQIGMTEEIAEIGIKRAYGSDDVTFPSKKIQEIRIIGNGFDIIKVRLK